MDMFDFFFPEQAEAAHLRQISRTLASSRRTSGTAAATARRNESELDDLRTDVRFLSLVIAAILKRLAEQETMSLGDVSDLLSDIDGLDGLPDGGLEPGVLRGILGVIKQEPTQPQEESDAINIVTTPRYRRR
ncbi:MAG: hypothetical protein QGF59_14105 [Pirellulaceae bacterium]|jgi:hypothetical protein|nr:hypothetical protein [Pirellulaceae bacterium]